MPAQCAREDTVVRLWQLTLDLNVLHQTNWTNKALEEIKMFEEVLLELVNKYGYSGRPQ